MSKPTELELELPTFLDDDEPVEIPTFICRTNTTKLQRLRPSNEAIASLELESFTLPLDVEK